MHEHEPIRRDETEETERQYWTQDLLLGETQIGPETSLARMKLHVADELLPSRSAASLVSLSTPNARSQATYVHAKPYILEPEISLTVDLFPSPVETGLIGRVERSTWEGMRHREIGNAQAWYYPSDQLLVSWECFLNDWCRQVNPLGDPTLRTVWTGFEVVLRDRFPAASRIVTPSWEDLYEKTDWHQFLGGNGYTPVRPGSFGKEFGITR